jgi:hypothetical protein
MKSAFGQIYLFSTTLPPYYLHLPHTTQALEICQQLRSFSSTVCQRSRPHTTHRGLVRPIHGIGAAQPWLLTPARSDSKESAGSQAYRAVKRALRQVERMVPIWRSRLALMQGQVPLTGFYFSMELHTNAAEPGPPLPPDVVEGMTDILAELLVLEFGTVVSPRGRNRDGSKPLNNIQTYNPPRVNNFDNTGLSR